MKRTNIYLDEEQTVLLNRMAADHGVPRAELVRKLLDRALHGRDGDAAADLAAIEGSFGALSDFDADARGDGERGAHLDRMWQSAG